MKILELTYKNKLILFDGDLGSGKTTLIRELCSQLGVREDVSSPTFSIINEYRTADNQTVYHFDLYRLSDPTEAESIGLSEYLDSGDLCMIEWPEKAPYYFDHRPVTKVQISHIDPETRQINISTDLRKPDEAYRF